MRRQTAKPSIKAGDLGHFRLLREFREALAEAQHLVDVAVLDRVLADLVGRRLGEVRARRPAEQLEDKARQVVESMAQTARAFRRSNA